MKEHISLLNVLEHYVIVLRKVNGYTLKGKCPLPQHTSDDWETFSVNFEKSVWSCHSASCVEARNIRKTDGSPKKGGDLIEFGKFMEKLPSTWRAGDCLEKWFGPFAKTDVRPETAEVAPVQVDETPAAVKNPAKGYMKEAETWLELLLIRHGQESWEEWHSRVIREIKAKLLASYWNGVNVGKGEKQEVERPVFKDGDVRVHLTKAGEEALKISA